jgi:hypothetical protein
VDTITWNNGKTSSLSASFTLIPPMAIATGTITRGEFAGAHTRSVVFVLPTAASACTSTGGLTRAPYQGVAVI